MKYRREIDGLRALAVGVVVIFHFFPIAMKNGFLGVDIFFVISGFLITTHLMQYDGKNVSHFVKEFYIRRVKRIFPALFVFFTITSLAVSFFLMRNDFNKFVSSLIAAMTFWANIFFWRDGGYFGGNDQLKPLLHTWSLSVEEQFYLFYPIYILFGFWLKKKLKFSLFLYIFLLTVSSFLLWIYLIEIDGNNPAFFLSPTRIWQFAIGGLVGIYLLRNSIHPFFVSNISLIISLMMLFISFFGTIGVQEQTSLVTIGSALFIISSTNQTSYLLSIFRNAVMVWLGKISYSVYLYHWPIAVVLLYYYVEHPPFTISLVGVIFSVMLGFASYKFVESPFRFKYKFKFTMLLIAICILISFTIIKIVDLKRSDSIADLWATASGTHFRCPVNTYFLYGGSRACLIEKGHASKPKIALFGNSHAQMYYPLFSEVLKNTENSGILVPMTGCLPMISVNGSKRCLELAKKNFEAIIEDDKIRHVFLAFTWYASSYIDPEGNKLDKTALLYGIYDILERFKAHGKSVSIISPIQIPGRDLASELTRKIKFKRITLDDALALISVRRKIFDDEFADLNKELEAKLNLDYIRVYDDLCDKSVCFFAKEETMIFADKHHLAESAVLKLSKTKEQLNSVLMRLNRNYRSR